MPKRRRERDRPKAGPEAAYNPTKRVLLSYASEDEQEDTVDQPAGTGHPSAADAATANYQIAPYPEDDDLSAHDNGNPVSGPPHDKTLEEDVRSSAAPKAPGRHRNVMSNGTTGQRIALGSLPSPWDQDSDSGLDDGEEVEYDSAEEEAMAYLRAVQSERQKLPMVFTAPQRIDDQQLYESGLGDSRGYLDDGAYIAAPLLGPTMPEAAKTLVDPQEAYTAALKQRFLTQHEQMHIAPSKSEVASLDEQHPATCRTSNSRAFAACKRMLRATAPQPAQVRAMDQSTVFVLLEAIHKTFLQREQSINPITGAWIWALLTRLDDVGTMTNEQVYPLRELGKRAVLVQLSFRDPSAAQALEAVGTNAEPASSNHDETQLDVDGDLAEPAKTSETTDDNLVNAKDESNNVVSQQTSLATLDMIITVVGELFGQRDLLEFRQQWQMEAVSVDTGA